MFLSPSGIRTLIVLTSLQWTVADLSAADQLVLPPAVPPAAEYSAGPSSPALTNRGTQSRIFSSGPVQQNIKTFAPTPQTKQVPVAPRPLPPPPAVRTAAVPAQAAVGPYCPETLYCPQQCGGCSDPSYLWFSAESLIWWTSGVNVPAIASTSPPGTPGLQAGIPGQPATSIVFGGNELFQFPQGGVRFRGGRWFDEREANGWQAEFLMLGSRAQNFTAASNGNPILARPFTNALNGAPDAQLIAFPGLSTGTLNFNAETRMYSMAVHYAAELIEDCGCDSCGGQCGESVGRSNRNSILGLKIGPRFTHLDDSLLVDESLTGVASGNQFRILDSFKTENSFLGGEIGIRGRRRWSKTNLDLGLNLAIGGTRQELDVKGLTTITTGGSPATTNGGFFAQGTNSGSWDRTRFSVIPELECALGYQVSDSWRFSVAYNLMYWTNVLRAAEQIDSTINPNQFPPAMATAIDPARPAPLFRESNYLAHGISFAIERRW